MASLKEAEAVSSELQGLAERLHTELTDGEIDLARLAQLADEMGGKADRLGETFASMNEALEKRLRNAGR
jgi:hypothetical protein